MKVARAVTDAPSGIDASAPSSPDEIADRTVAAALAREWLAVGAATTDARTFIALCLTFGAVLWGELVRGAFFRTDLTVFTVLAVAAAVLVPGAVQALTETSWVLWSAGSMVAAVAVSAVARHQLVASLYPLAAIAAATSFAVVGICVAHRWERLHFARAVVDAGLLTSLLGLIGTVQHMPRFAELQAEGWRASARIGYANATGIVLVTALLCACWLAHLSGARSDRIRAWIIFTGLIATQSRGALLAVVLCWLIYQVAHRPSARILAQSTAWSLVAFVGIIPAIERDRPQPLFALVGAGIALVLLVVTGSGLSERSVRLLVSTIGLSAAVTAVVLLNTRVADSGSNTGRLRLWHEAFVHLRVTGILGAGPEQLASFSNSKINQLFDHNDALQYAQYYGLLGVAALAITVASLAFAFRRSRARVTHAAWALGLGAVVALACDALVDFPMQVPLLPATVSLVLGLTLGSARRVDHNKSIDDHNTEGIAL